jgi:hypothetical protein
VPKLQELTISAESISLFQLKCFGKNYWTDVYGGWDMDDDDDDADEDDRYEIGTPADSDRANFAAFDELTHLHLYFANMDMMTNKLLGMVQALPKLTHLRLTRPSSRYTDTSDLESETAHHGDLAEALEVLLGDERRTDKGPSKLEMILVQVGPDTSQYVLEKILYVQRVYPSRLQVFAPSGIRPFKMTRAQWVEQIANPVKDMLGLNMTNSQLETMIAAMTLGRKVSEIKIVDTEEEVAAGLDEPSVTDKCERRAFKQWWNRSMVQGSKVFVVALMSMNSHGLSSNGCIALESSNDLSIRL